MMVDASALRKILLRENESFRAGLVKNEELLAVVDEWVVSIQDHIELLKSIFNCESVPSSSIQENPEGGDFWVVVEVCARAKDINDLLGQEWEYHRKAVALAGHRRFGTIVLDVTPLIR